MRKVISILTKNIICASLLFVTTSNNVYAESYIRDYTYTASEADSKLSSRIIALDQIKILLLQEIGTHIRQEINISKNGGGETLASEDIEAITAGFTKVDILEEKWNGTEYFLKARIEANTKNVLNALEVFKTHKSEDDKKNLEALKANKLELEEARQRIKNLQKQLNNSNNYKQTKETISLYKKSIEDFSRQLINIRVPDKILNGAVVPFFVNFTPSVQSGDKIYILVGKTKYAYKFTPKGNVTLSHVSGRIKNRFGELTVIVERSDGAVFTKTAELSGHIFDQFTDGPNKAADCKKIGRGNYIKMLCSNNMGRSGYINKIDITLSNGSVGIDMTPNASMNPFLWVTGNFDASINQTKASVTMQQFVDENFSIDLPH